MVKVLQISDAIVQNVLSGGAKLFSYFPGLTPSGGFPQKNIFVINSV
jgi:hypothetical protein